jgi:hypothetical protein
MIYKKPGCIKLEKLCIIHSFEADFNLVIGLLFGQKAMYHASEHNLIHQGQYCKKAGKCNTMVMVMLKVLHNLFAWLTKTPMGGQFKFDSTAYFVMLFILHCFIAIRTLTTPYVQVGTYTSQYHLLYQNCFW